MNRGQLTSLTYCKKCRQPIEIYPHWEEVICKRCGALNNLKYNLAEDNNLVYYDNTEFINELKGFRINKDTIRQKRLNINKIKTLEDVKRVLEFLDIKVDIKEGLIRKGFDKVEDLFE